MNTLRQRRCALASPSAMRRSRLVAAYVAEIKCELLHSVRSPNVIVFSVIFPLMFYLLVGFVFGLFRSDEPNARTHALVGFVIMAAMTPGFMSFAAVLAAERDRGLHALRRALPMPPGANLIAKAFAATLCVAIVVPLLLALGAAFGKVELRSAQIVAVWGLALLGALPFGALGLFIGVRASGRSAPVIVNVSFVPMLYLSGALFPLPLNFAWLAHFAPPFYLQQLILAAAGAPHRFVVSPLVHWCVLAGVTILFAALAIRRFRAVG